MLGPQGVRVLSAPLPSDALRICGEQNVDVLISDISMPEMDGNRLAKNVMKLLPGVNVLLISGEQDPSLKSGRARFLKKPFFPAELIKLLREMLAEKTECA